MRIKRGHLLVGLIMIVIIFSACTPSRPAQQRQEQEKLDVLPVQQPVPLPSTPPEPLPAQQPVSDKQPQKEEKLKEVNLYKDLIISSGDFVINHTFFSLHGNLVVNGTGKLAVVDSEIHFIQDYNQQYRAYIKDNAVLKMDNVKLTAEGKWFNFDYSGNANVRLNKVTGWDCCTPWHGAMGNVKFDITNSSIGITLNNNVTVTARGKSSLFFELVLADVKGEFSLPIGDVDKFSLDIPNNGNDMMKIDVYDSSFYDWGTTLDKHTDVTFKDTKMTIGMNAGSDWRLPSPTVKASGLKALKYDDFSLKFDTNTLHLLNTSVRSWYPQAWNGATIELSDSDLADLQNNGKDSKLIISNSKVDIAIARQNVVQLYYDSEIRQDVIVHDDAMIHLYNMKVGGRMIENGNGQIFIDGKRLDVAR